MRSLFDRLRGTSEEFSFLLIFVPGLLLSISYRQNTMSMYRTQIEDRFRATVSTRAAHLVGQMKSHERSLDASVAFFASSDRVEPDEFEDFARAMSVEGVVGLCWSSDAQRLSSPHGAEAACRRFEVLEPSKIVEGPQPVIFLSRFATSRDQQQRGFVSLLVDLRSMLLAPVQLEIDEQLIVHDIVQNTIATFSFEGDAIDEADPEDGAYHEYFELKRFGDVSFLYLARYTGTLRSRSTDLTAALLWLLSGVLAVYVRGLIHKRSEIQLEVERRTEELAQFAYRTSHDLRGPLVTVGGLCRVALEDLRDGETAEVADNLQRIASQVGRLDRLVGDILALTQADLGDPQVEPVQLADLIDEVVDQVRVSLWAPTIEIRTHTETTGPHLLPKIRVRQILENLVSNSIKYADPERSCPFVYVSVSEEGQGLKILVRDNGLGIPEVFHERLFRKFERFHPEASSIGSGLGLSIVKKHIDRLGGTITVESSPEGSCFTSWIPTAGAIG